MPWTGASFKKHNKGLGKSGSAHAAKVANAVLRESGDEGKAIRIANWQAAGRPKREAGGKVDPRAGGRGYVPYQRGGRMGVPPKGAGQYLTGEAGPEVMMPSDGSPPSVVGAQGPEVIRPKTRGSIIPHHELKRLGRKYSKRVGGGQIETTGSSANTRSDEPKEQSSAGGQSAAQRRQFGGPVVSRLQKRGIISNAKKEKHLGKYERPGASRHGGSMDSDTTPIDASSR
jgi:hypothetical protein